MNTNDAGNYVLEVCQEVIQIKNWIKIHPKKFIPTKSHI
jgi:hypothetical protein